MCQRGENSEASVSSLDPVATTASDPENLPDVCRNSSLRKIKCTENLLSGERYCPLTSAKDITILLAANADSTLG